MNIKVVKTISAIPTFISPGTTWHYHDQKANNLDFKLPELKKNWLKLIFFTTLFL